MESNRILLGVTVAIFFGIWVSLSNWQQAATVAGIMLVLLFALKGFALGVRHDPKPQRDRKHDNDAWGQGRYGRGRWDQ